MKTLNQIKYILDAYCYGLHSLHQLDETTYKQQEAEARQRMVECFDMLSNIAPELVQVNLPEFLCEEDAEAFKNRIKQNASQRYALDTLPLPTYNCERINDDEIFTPGYAEWQTTGNSRQNFVINYGDSTKQAAQDALNGLLLNIMIALPPKAVRLNIFDFSMTGMTDLFTVNLDPQLYHDEIVMDNISADKRLKELAEQMGMVMKKYGNLAVYNCQRKEIAMPYELVVLNNYPDNYDNLIDRLKPLYENGARCGVYFIVLNNTDAHFKNTEQQGLLAFDNYQVIDLPNLSSSGKGLISFTPIHRNPVLRNICFDYLREETCKVAKRATLKQDFEALHSAEYEPVMSEISVTVGLNIESKEEVTLRFNSGDYVHAFILGQSGSGKSVLLNNIITSAINKYAPEDLMLYLMDFKGVEFNRYRDVKHAKAVLVDNSDPQMTLEVLRELKEENRRRVKLWQQEGVNNIDGYNRTHPDERLPQVLFVADECQVMFARPSGSQTNITIAREIADILNIIATQGRSQGIHMLLATQQLDETDISGQVLKNLTECFLLMSSPSDSDKLVPDSSSLTEKQPTGQCCYYHKKELQAQVQTFYATDEELEAAIATSGKKAALRQSNGGAYFKGSAMFWFDEQEHEALRAASVRYPMAAFGREIGMKGRQALATLRNDYSENILIFGANREEQALAVSLNALMSLMESYKQIGTDCRFVVIDCYDNPEGNYYNVLHRLADEGMCRVYGHSDCGEMLRLLAEDVKAQRARPTVLTILGNEKFSEIKRKTPFSNEKKQPAVADDSMPNAEYLNTLNNIMGGLEQSGTLQPSDFKTYILALRYIWDEGPTEGVHTILQVDKPANILHDESWNTDAEKFRHRIILRSENKYLSSLRLSAEIDVEVLSEEEEHLRAYYYPEDGEPQLFTPFLIPNGK